MPDYERDPEMIVLLKELGRVGDEYRLGWLVAGMMAARSPHWFETYVARLIEAMEADRSNAGIQQAQQMRDAADALTETLRWEPRS